MRPEELKSTFGFDDIGLLPTDRSSITSRKAISTQTHFSKNCVLKYPLIASPMDTIYSRDLCIALNLIGAAGVIHRFMSIDEQVKEAAVVKEKSGKCYAAINLHDYPFRVPELVNAGVDLLYLDTANGSSVLVEHFMAWYNEHSKFFSSKPDIVIGNTLTKASVRKAITLGADGIRHGIGIGSVCQTSLMTGIECPPVTALYYAWKAMRNYNLEKVDTNTVMSQVPSILLDGGIQKPADLVKAIVSGADAVISGRIFAGCIETPGEVHDGMKTYRGMASLGVVRDYQLSDLADLVGENLFVEGREESVPYNNKSVIEVVYEFANGLRSAMSYLGFSSIEEMRGSLWTGECIGVLTK